MKFLNSVVLILFCCFFSEASAQVEGLTFEEVDRLQSITPRPIVVFIYTEWCDYCHAMQQTTFKNKKIGQLLHDEFYFIPFNAAEERAITFSGHTFQFKPSGRHTGVHELAEQLGTIEGNLSYPTTCILNEKYELVFQYGGFLTAKVLSEILAHHFQ